MRRLALIAVVTAGCTDFATPNQLEKPTIVAVVAEPPVVRPGATAALSIAVADRGGVLMMPPTTWALVEAYPGVPPMGTITGDATGATYVAPATIPDRGMSIPPVDAVTVTVTTSTGPLTAVKAMPVAALDAANPTIAALTVGGADAQGGIAVTRGATLSMQVTTAPATGEDARFAWYTPVGDIANYQSNPAELVVPMDAESGPLIVVVRDGQGGLVWRQITLTVQ
jgi:hypothetical protein